jgi:hypothetical protein
LNQGRDNHIIAMPTVVAYNAGMASTQYTIRNISKHLDAQLRRLAKQRQVSLNKVVVDMLTSAVAEPVVNHEFDQFFGTWTEDKGFDRVIETFAQIDAKDWQ